MLIEFTVRNFKSILEPMTLSAETGSRLTKLSASNTIVENDVSLLKNLVIVGPNGSGKTVLISALVRLQQLVLSANTRVTDNLPYSPFKMNPNARRAPSEFQVTFNAAGQTIEYRLAYLADQVTEERLVQITGNKRQTYFERHGQVFTVLPSALAESARETRPNALFLFNAQARNDELASVVFRWFKTDLVLVDNVGATFSEDLMTLVKQKRVRTELLRFLRFADFNIVGITVREVPSPAAQLIAQLSQAGVNVSHLASTRQQLYTLHKVYDEKGTVVDQVELPLSSESRGTQKIFLIALSIIQAQLNGNGKTLIFDEFDDSLHLELSQALIQIFNSKANRNQFILTTHELKLLDEALRIDQLYLMAKDFKGQSTLNSIFDFKDARGKGRHDIGFMRRYMEGRFGALPQLSVEDMLSALTALDQDPVEEQSDGTQV